MKQFVFGRIEPQLIQQKVRNRRFFIGTAPKTFPIFLLHQKSLLIGALMEQIKPIVKEEHEFEYRDKSNLWERN